MRPELGLQRIIMLTYVNNDTIIELCLKYHIVCTYWLNAKLFDIGGSCFPDVYILVLIKSYVRFPYIFIHVINMMQ